MLIAMLRSLRHVGLATALCAACNDAPPPASTTDDTTETSSPTTTSSSSSTTAAPPSDADTSTTTGTTSADATTDATDGSTGEEPMPTWRSELYPEDWTPDHTGPEGRFLHDFSYAGYRNGEAELGQELPATVIDVVAAHGADPSGTSDSTAAIQAAIDAAALAGGAIVFLPAGLYRVDGRLAITASHIVLQVNGRKFVPSAGQWVHGKLLEPLGAYAAAEDGHAVSVTVLRSNCTLEEALRLLQSPAGPEEKVDVPAPVRVGPAQ